MKSFAKIRIAVSIALLTSLCLTSAPTLASGRDDGKRSSISSIQRVFRGLYKRTRKSRQRVPGPTQREGPDDSTLDMHRVSAPGARPIGRSKALVTGGLAAVTAGVSLIAINLTKPALDPDVSNQVHLGMVLIGVGIGTTVAGLSRPVQRIRDIRSAVGPNTAISAMLDELPKNGKLEQYRGVRGIEEQLRDHPERTAIVVATIDGQTHVWHVGSTGIGAERLKLLREQSRGAKQNEFRVYETSSWAIDSQDGKPYNAVDREALGVGGSTN